MVVHLDPEAGNQLLGLLAGERPVGQALVVKRLQVLVEVAGGHGIPAVKFGYGGEVYKPIHLQGFPKIARGLGGHPTAYGGNAQQFGLALGVCFVCGHPRCEVGMAFREKDGRVAGDVHGRELLGAVDGPRVVQKVQRRPLHGDLGLEIEHPLAIDGAVQGRVPRRALLHELGEQTGGIGASPFLRKIVEDAVAHAAAAPIGNDVGLIGPNLLLGDAVACHEPRVQDPQILGAVTGQFGEGRHGLGPRAALADDQFIRAEVYGFLAAEMHEIEGAQHGCGVLPEIFLVKLRHEQGALDGDARWNADAFLSKALNAFVHGFILPCLLPSRTRPGVLRHRPSAALKAAGHAPRGS